MNKSQRIQNNLQNKRAHLILSLVKRHLQLFYLSIRGTHQLLCLHRILFTISDLAQMLQIYQQVFSHSQQLQNMFDLLKDQKATLTTTRMMCQCLQVIQMILLLLHFSQNNFSKIYSFQARRLQDRILQNLNPVLQINSLKA